MSDLNNPILNNAVYSLKADPRESFNQEPTEASSYGLGTKDLWSRAFRNDSLGAIGMNAAENYREDVDFDIDTKFDFDSTLKATIEADPSINIHPDFIDNFKSRARNEQHFSSLIDHYKTESAKQRYLEDQGFWTNFGLGMAAEVTNAPLYIGAAYLLPATAAIASSTALARFATSGAAGAALEGIKDVVGEQDKNKWDYAAAVLLDGTMGAIFGSGGKSAADELNKKVLYELGIDENKLTEVNKATTKEEKRKIAQRAYEEKVGKDADKTVLDALDEQIQFANTSGAEKMWSAVRQDLAYVTGKSQSETFSSFSKEAFPDALLKDINLENLDMVTARDLLEEVIRSKRQTLFNPLVRRWVYMNHEELSLSKIKAQAKDEQIFSEMIGEIQLSRRIYGWSKEEAIDTMMRTASFKGMDGNKLADVKDLLMESADKMEEFALYTHQKFRESGHPDFQEGGIPPDPTYMPFSYSKQRFAALSAKGVNKGHMIDFFIGAIKSSETGQELTEEQARMIAESFYILVGRSEIKKINTFGDILDDIIHSGSYSADIVDFAVNFKESLRGQQKGLVKGVNELSPINHSYESAVEIDGAIIPIRMIDFMERNYLDGMEMYGRKMAGATQLAKYKWTYRDPDQLEPLIDLKTGGQTTKVSEKTFNKLKKRIAESPIIKKMEDQLSDLKKKFNIDNDSYRLLQSTIADIGKTLDGRTRVAKAIKKALDSGDLQKAAELAYEEVNKNLDKFSNVDINTFLDLFTRSKSGYQKQFDDFAKEIEIRKQDMFDEEVSMRVDGAERTLETREDIEDFTAQVARELDKQVESGAIEPKTAFRDQIRLKTILKDLLGEPTAKDPGSTLNQSWMVASSLNMGRLLGTTFLTMPAEIVRVAYDQGIRNIVSSFPMIKSLLKGYSTGKIDNKQLQEIHDYLGMFSEFFSSPRAFELDHGYSSISQSRSATGKLKKGLDKTQVFADNFAEFTLMVGGVKPIQAWLQAAHAMGVFKRMKKVANGGKETSGYKRVVAELGLSPSSEKRVLEQIKMHSKDDIMNFDKWDVDVREMFLHGVKRRSDTIVQVQRLGDKPAWTIGNDEYMLGDTLLGKLVYNLKSFMFTAYVKQLGHAVSRADMYTAGLIMSQSLALVLSVMAKNQLIYAGDEKKLRESMDPENIIKKAIGIMPQTSLIPGTIDTISMLTTQKPVFGQTRHQDLITNATASLPTLDLAKRVAGILAIPYKMSDGVEASDFNDVAALTGVSNSWLTRTLWHNMSRKTVFDQKKPQDREFKPDYRLSP